MSGVRKGKPFVIPELEAAPNVAVRVWSEEEEKIVGAYYGKKGLASIAKYLKEHYPPGRSQNAIRKKFYELRVDGKA